MFEHTEGYVIRYSLKKNASGGARRTVTDLKTTKKVLRNLKANKTYYVKIRTVKKVGDFYFYSTWSTVQKIRTKGKAANEPDEAVEAVEALELDDVQLPEVLDGIDDSLAMDGEVLPDEGIELTID